MNVSDINVDAYRKPEHEIESLFYRRWSPRAMSGEPISEAELNALFEAARWAPSSFNEQPWRIIFARRDTPHWDKLYDLLAEANQAWTKNAAVLLLIVSKKTFTKNGKPNKVHVFDAGSWWENLALEATRRGLVAHGMAGFDATRAPQALGIPDDFTACAMVAIGKPGEIDDLPEQFREGEKPNSRRPVAETVMEGTFRS